MKAFVKALIKAKEQKALAITFEHNPEYFWMEVESSNIKRVRHSHTHSEDIVESGCSLDVEFKSTQVYRYKDVPKKVYNELLVAESVGKYFIEHVKTTYPATLLTPKK